MACPGQNPPADYSEANIHVLTGLEHIRRSPGMYIGNTDVAGLFHLLLELVSNSLAEVVAGYGHSVRITLHPDGSATVADDGRPPPNVETTFAELNGHHGICPYPGGREYFAYPVANALAEWMRVEACSGGELYHREFSRGAPGMSARMAAAFGRDGLTVSFRPDPQIFGAASFDAGAIRARLRQLAFLHSGVRITFADESAGTHDEFEYADGIRDYVQFLNEGRPPLHPDVIVLRGDEEGVRYEVGLQWTDEMDEVRQSFANHSPTPVGGTHERGMTAGAALGLRDFARVHQSLPGEFISDDLRTGLTAVVSVWLAEPTFEGRSRVRINNPEAETVIAAAVRRGVREYFEANADDAKRVVSAAVAARDARVEASAVRKKRRQSRSDQ